MSEARTPVTTIRLDVSGRETVLAAEPSGAEWTLPVGTDALWPRSDAGPSAVAIENAIQTVEDAIERIAAQVPRPAQAQLASGVLAPLRRDGVIEGLSQGHLTMEQVEREYQRLAARSAGAPSARGSGFGDPAGDALVLILRELMHHLGWSELRVRD